MSHDNQSAWLAAFQQTQQITADAHTAYQKAMADTHVAFLQSVQTALGGLTAIATGQPMPAPQPVAAPLVLTPQPIPASRPLAPAPVAAAPAVVRQPAPTPQAAPAPVASPAPAAAAPVAPTPVAPTPVATAPASSASAAPKRDLEALMLSVVAESTGYPAEMLAMSMNLEADLGIDSIKRVEILSAVTEKAPELPEIDASAMGALQTLGEIVDFLRAQLGGQVAEPTPVAATPATVLDVAGHLHGDVFSAALRIKKVFFVWLFAWMYYWYTPL